MRGQGSGGVDEALRLVGARAHLASVHSAYRNTTNLNPVEVTLSQLPNRSTPFIWYNFQAICLIFSAIHGLSQLVLGTGNALRDLEERVAGERGTRHAGFGDGIPKEGIWPEIVGFYYGWVSFWCFFVLFVECFVSEDLGALTGIRFIRNLYLLLGLWWHNICSFML